MERWIREQTKVRWIRVKVMDQGSIYIFGSRGCVYEKIVLIQASIKTLIIDT